MELKLESFNRNINKIMCSNRTFMELKYTHQEASSALAEWF